MIRLGVLLLLVAGSARAETVLRVATIVPDGTSWARELKALGRDAAAATAGELRVKWYMGGIAGDEVQVLDRIRRDQLDGILSGGMVCERIAPSLRAMRIPGIVQTWDEASYVVRRLKPTFDKESRQNGFVNLAEVGIGPSIVFSRTPIDSLDALKRGRYWIWDIDEVLKLALPAIGLHTVPTPIYDGGRIYDGGGVDGFLTPAAAALGFQWSNRVRYFTDLRVSFVSGCLLVANRFFDALPVLTQQALRGATAKAQARGESVGRAQEEALLGGLFQKQGLTAVPVSESFRSAFFEAARSSRARLTEELVPKALILQMLALLADFRAEHR